MPTSAPFDAPPSALLPQPLRQHRAPGGFTLDALTTLTADPALAPAARWLRGVLAPVTGGDLAPGPHGIRITHDPDLDAEEYRLTVRDLDVVIEAGDAAGAFYGAQTLRQLLPPAAFRSSAPTPAAWTVPGVAIQDRPRFGWRGVLLDVARHYLPKHEVLRLLDLMALHKLNVLHMHLTDDQGWRFEVKRYPRLTEVGAWRRETMLGRGPDFRYDNRPHGGYYTQDDLREIVAYAADRCITVVPEVDLPGHVQAAVAAYPELGVTGEAVEVGTAWGPSEVVLNAEESTVAFFRHVFDELLDVFPSAYVCVGGDECVKTQWRADGRTQQRIAELGLEDEHALQGWFVGRIAAHLAARGRKIMGWDELLDGPLPPGAAIASWRGLSGAKAAAERGHEVISCPLESVYLDFRQSDHPDEPMPIGCVTTLAGVHAFEPVPTGLAPHLRHLVVGAQAALWSEHMDTPRALDYLAFPRLAAFAEAVWGPAERDFAEFTERLALHLRRLDALGVEYRPPGGPRPWQRRPDLVGWPRELADLMNDVFEDSA